MSEAQTLPDERTPAEKAGVAFVVDSVTYGHAHKRIEGSYTGPATTDLVRAEFYHFLFGGRDAWVRDGRFGCVIHTD